MAQTTQEPPAPSDSRSNLAIVKVYYFCFARVESRRLYGKMVSLSSGIWLERASESVRGSREIAVTAIVSCVRVCAGEHPKAA